MLLAACVRGLVPLLVPPCEQPAVTTRLASGSGQSPVHLPALNLSSYSGCLPWKNVLFGNLSAQIPFSVDVIFISVSLLYNTLSLTRLLTCCPSLTARAALGWGRNSSSHKTSQYGTLGPQVASPGSSCQLKENLLLPSSSLTCRVTHPMWLDAGFGAMGRSSSATSPWSC